MQKSKLNIMDVLGLLIYPQISTIKLVTKCCSNNVKDSSKHVQSTVCNDPVLGHLQDGESIQQRGNNPITP